MKKAPFEFPKVFFYMLDIHITSETLAIVTLGTEHGNVPKGTSNLLTNKYLPSLCPYGTSNLR